MNITMKLFLVLLLSTAGLQSFAERSGGEGRMGMKMLKELNLTDDQKEKIKAIRQKHKGDKGEREHYGKKIKELKKQMKEKLGSSASSDEIKALRSEIKALKEKKKARRAKKFDKMLEIREVLTVEQRKKFQELRQQRKKKRRHHDDD